MTPVKCTLKFEVDKLRRDNPLIKSYFYKVFSFTKEEVTIKFKIR